MKNRFHVAIGGKVFKKNWIVKSLNELKNIQDEINIIEEEMDAIKLPQCKLSYDNRIDMVRIIVDIMDGRTDPINLFKKYSEQKEYIKKFGVYLVNLTEYQDFKKGYETELLKLRGREAGLKEYLGIT